MTKKRSKNISKKRVSRRNKTQAGGSQELINAVAAGDMNKVDDILTTDAYVDVNYTNKNGYTPLLAACRKDNLYIVRTLLDNGANVNIPNSNNSPLNNAVKSGHIDVVNELLDRGADPTWTDMSDRGIVERANTPGNQEMVNLLIDKGFRNGYYTRQHAERDGVLNTFKQRPVVIESNGIEEVFEHENYHYLPEDLRQVIQKYFGGKRKTKKSKAKKGSKKRVSRRNKNQK